MSPSPAPSSSVAPPAPASRWIGVAAIALAAVAVYHNSLHGAFVFDDQGNVIDNESLRHWSSPAAWFTPPVEAGVAGRPLANLTLALNYAAGGLDVRGYHAANLLLHALAALVLFGLVRRTLLMPPLRARFGAECTPLALAIAGLWLVHPLTSATVDYVSQRTELLAALAVLLTLYGFGRSVASGSRAWAGLAVGACGLGLASKETAVVAPVLVLLYDRTFAAGTLRQAWCVRRRFYVALGATWLLLAGLMAASRLADRGVGLGLGVSPVDYACTECSALLRYLKLALWPAPLVFDYGWSFTRHPAAVVAIVLALGGTGLALWRRQTWAFAGAWCFVALAPTSSFVPIVEQPIAENRPYLALAGMLALAVLLLFAAFGRRAWLVVAGLALAGGTLTFQRNRDYADQITLWGDTVAKRPLNARARSNLAGALLLAGHAEAALPHALAAGQLQPGYPEAEANAGAALVQLGRVAEAIPHFATALATAGSNPSAHRTQVRAHNDLGVALLQVGRVAEAITHDREAVRLAPEFAEARYNLGNALAQAGQLPGAIEQLATAVRLKPDFAKAHNNLGAVLLRAGRRTDAVAEFEAALRLQPDYADARRNLALAQVPPDRLSPHR